MGAGSKVISVFLRLGELCSAAIVAGFVGEYLHYVSNAHDHANSRMVYTIALAGTSIVVSLVCLIPLNVLFFGFLLDAALFVMWMTAFGLLINLTGSAGCNSTWYWSSWGYYWGGWWYNPIVANQSIVGTAACGKWRATLAWSFVGGCLWLCSAILGACVVSKIRHGRQGKYDERGIGDENPQSRNRPSTGAAEETREVPSDRVVNPASVV